MSMGGPQCQCRTPPQWWHQADTTVRMLDTWLGSSSGGSGGGGVISGVCAVKRRVGRARIWRPMDAAEASESFKDRLRLPRGSAIAKALHVQPTGGSGSGNGRGATPRKGSGWHGNRDRDRDSAAESERARAHGDACIADVATTPKQHCDIVKGLVDAGSWRLSSHNCVQHLVVFGAARPGAQ